MASQLSQQIAFRAQKSLGLVGGTPDYKPLAAFAAPDVPARTFHYSADGRLYAYALPTLVRIFQAENAKLLLELPLPNIIELQFSPRGTYLSTWERPVKYEDGTQHKNLRVFSASTGEELISFTQKSQDGWDLQYTISESHAIRLVGPEVQVFRPAEWSKGIVDKLKVEGATSVTLSPGLNPSIAVFVAEKKGAPASIKVYGLLTLSAPPTCQKTFFKADRAQIKWNNLGTQVLILTQTEVDNSNKSYYGETGLYLLSSAGNFDCRVTLDKEGPIHDFSWSPNSKEFGVVYGYMPAKVTLFDQRVRSVHDFGSAPYNFISFNPHARLVALAGFGNLAGKIDIFDRRSLTKVCTIDAPNTSHCEWSPDGRFLLTATLSPRLRVDNGIKVWHCSGPLVHFQLIDELYQTSWRPTLVDAVPPFPPNMPPAPEPSESAKLAAATVKATPTKPPGAYRPPGARGLATPSIFKREDEGGAPHSGTSTPSRGYNRSPVPGAAQNGYVAQNGHGHGGRRHVPGAAQAPSPGPDGEKKGNRKRKGKKDGDEQQQGQGQQREQREQREPREPREPRANGQGGKHGKGRQNQNGTPKPNGEEAVKTNGNGAAPPTSITVPELVLNTDVGTPMTPGPDSALDPIARKVRNLNKKLKAIDELKDKQKRGERLEVTQLKKIEGEAEIRKELSGLGATA
ncbi:hypothetical protein HGRIS_013833 [Hohenbuehelia grisea]|uniref:Eukaryotic translation initiation factor 2A n=1 Tax=Hohenbuehelia grisea TaxID=104357 RepID=A0ABR3IWT1_9AGAR